MGTAWIVKRFGSLCHWWYIYIVLLSYEMDHSKGAALNHQQPLILHSRKVLGTFWRSKRYTRRTNWVIKSCLKAHLGNRVIGIETTEESCGERSEAITTRFFLVGKNASSSEWQCVGYMSPNKPPTIVIQGAIATEGSRWQGRDERTNHPIQISTPGHDDSEDWVYS